MPRWGNSRKPCYRHYAPMGQISERNDLSPGLRCMMTTPSPIPIALLFMAYQFLRINRVAFQSQTILGRAAQSHSTMRRASKGQTIIPLVNSEQC